MGVLGSGSVVAGYSWCEPLGEYSLNNDKKAAVYFEALIVP